MVCDCRWVFFSVNFDFVPDGVALDFSVFVKELVQSLQVDAPKVLNRPIFKIHPAIHIDGVLMDY